MCIKCGNYPKINKKDNEIISISCDKCNITSNENIKSIINYSSKWVSMQSIIVAQNSMKNYMLIYIAKAIIYLCVIIV